MVEILNVFFPVFVKIPHYPLPEKCPYLELFWSVFSSNEGKYGPEYNFEYTFTRHGHIDHHSQFD